MIYLPYANRIPSPNHGGALKDPKYIVVHYTAGRSLAESTRWLCDKRAKASAHLIIGADGVGVNQLVPFNAVAWHAGESAWRGLVGLNRSSIGVELDNVGPLLKTADGQYRSPTTGVIVPPANVVHGKLEGCAWEHWCTYPSAQIETLVRVCHDLVEAFPSIVDVVGHSDIAPGRKQDPGPAFDMPALRGAVFGRV